jgi:NADH-quinone oxidoreductase subunit L
MAGAPAAAEHGAAAEPAGEPAAAHDTSTELLFTVLSIVIAFVGIAIGYLVFSKNPLRRLPKILEDKWRLDELYDRTIIWPINRLSTDVLWKAVDVRSIDGLVNLVADSVRGLGGTLRFLQTGLARSYVAVILFGAAVIIGYFMLQGGILDLLRK